MDINVIAIVSIVIDFVCAIIIAIDLTSRPQKMWIMNIVWPVTALYAGPLGLWAYYSIGRADLKSEAAQHAMTHNPLHQKSSWQSVLKGALHCGSGCTLGDLISASLLLFIPITILGSKLVGEWVIEYIAAFLIGIVFQYYAIKPMKQLSTKDALVAALKADTLSLTAWQVGMYGWMAISNFLIFHHRLNASTPVFWLMMQIGMLLGLATAYPVNWWLIKTGIKEAM